MQLNSVPISLFLAMSICACCSDIQISHSVDPDPLYRATLPQEVEKLSDLLPRQFLDQVPKDESKTRLTDNWFFTEFQSSTAYDIVYLEIELFASEDESANRYLETCGDSSSYQHPENFTFEGTTGNQYCITYIRQAREGPEGFCQPYGMYSTQVVFQKGQILIILRELSANTSNSELNSVISIIAEPFRSK